MALPDLIDAKAYLRLDTDVEDELIDAALATAQALVQQVLKVPLTSEARTFQGRRAQRGYRGEPQERLTVPVQPCDATATITDVDGDAVDSDTYTIDARTGWINAERLETFDNGPYTVAIDVGYQFDPNYDADVEPLLRQAILDLTSDIYSRRNAGAIYEQSGGQVSITYTEADIPARTQMLLRALRLRGRAW